MRTSVGSLTAQRSRSTEKAYAKALAIYAAFAAFGFPGRLSEVLPASICTLVDYSGMFAEIGAMFFHQKGNAESAWELNVASFKSRFFWPYMILISFFLTSAISTSYPKEEFVSCFRFAVTALFALWLAEKYEVKEILEVLYGGQFVFILATLAFMVLRPDLAHSYEMGGAASLCGLFDRKNAFAAELSAGILIQTILARMKSTRGERFPIPFVASYVVQWFMLFACNATGATLTCVVTSAYAFLWRRNRKKLPVGPIYSSISILFPFLAMTILPPLTPLFELFGKDATLSGRTTTWDAITEIMLENRTFTGFGFNMFWRDSSAMTTYHSMFMKNTWYSEMTSGAHNMTLELWVNVGLIGVAVFYLAFAVVLSRTNRLEDDAYLFCAPITFSFLMKGLTERLINPNNYHTLLVFLCLAVAAESKWKTRATTVVDRKRREEERKERRRIQHINGKIPPPQTAKR